MLAGLVPSLLAVAIGLALLILVPQAWAWTVFAEYMAMMLVLARKLGLALGGAGSGPGLGFIPLVTVVRLFLRGVWSNFALGVDKAQSDDAARAEQFLAAAEARSGNYRAVVRHARALVLARSGETTAALSLVAESNGDSELPSSTRGWLGTVVSQILATAGQDVAARAQLQAAIPLLSNRRARGIRVAAQLHLVDMAIKEGDYGLALELLTDVRWQALRRRNLELVATTEGYLVRMMSGMGNRAGALWTLEQISPRDARRVRATETSSQTAMWSVLHAQVALEEGDLASAERQALSAVKRGELLADEGPRAAAHLILADVRHRDGRANDALPHVLIALSTLQQVRYRLPTSSWRRNWVQLNTRAYELALEIASTNDDPFLVAELIETIRAHAVPVGAARTARRLETLLGALMDPALKGSAGTPKQTSDRQSRAQSAALALAGVDLLRPPAAIYVGGTSWLTRSADAVTDLDALIESTMGGDGWYWSACIAAATYWWAVRRPDGSWLWGSADMSEGSLARVALSDLLAALPIRRPGESDIELDARIKSSPLWDLRNDARSGATLLDAVAHAFLPEPLQEALAQSSTHEPTRVLVSLNGALAALPINALPIDSDRLVIDAAAVSHIPAAALLDRFDDVESDSLHRRAEIVLAVIDPDPRLQRLRAQPPKSAGLVLERPTTKRRLMDALRQADAAGVFCAFAHYRDAPVGTPATGGLALADGVLSLRDLAPSADALAEDTRVPERILLAMCESLGAGARDSVLANEEASIGSSTWEWLGLTTGFLLAGARFVVATAWPLPNVRAANQFDHEIAHALTQPNPGIAVRNAILGLTSPQQRGRIPVAVWAAYSYLGPLRPADGQQKPS
jgi:hypothetical protein